MKATIENATNLLGRVVQVDTEMDEKAGQITQKMIDENI